MDLSMMRYTVQAAMKVLRRSLRVTVAASRAGRWIAQLILCAGLIISGSAGDLCAAKRYALVVGVKKYRPGQPLPDLPYTERDADELAKVLSAGGYQVTLMTQTIGRVEGKEVFEPQQAYLRDQIDALLGNPFLKQDDMVLVALAGHGVQFELDEAGKKSPKFYFCPADADVAQIKTANEITERNRLIDLNELYQAMNACRAGGKLLLVDACRNDPSKPSVVRSLASATLPPLPPPPGGTAAFFSCSANQRAFEDKDLQHGVFFHHVIQALKGDADSGNSKRPADGKITLSELSEHVAVTTYDYVRQKYNGAKQAPELKGEFRLTIPIIELASIPSPRSLPTIPMPVPNAPLAKPKLEMGIGLGWRDLVENDFVNVNCDPETFEWKNGTIHCSGTPTGAVRTKAPLTNFELVAEWRLENVGGNSGIAIWAHEDGLTNLAQNQLPKEGIEFQILDHDYRKMFEQSSGEKGDWFSTHGDIIAKGGVAAKPLFPNQVVKVRQGYIRIFPTKNLTKGAGQWNHYFARCVNGEIQFSINGEVVSGAKECQPRSGYLCLQSEQSPIEFRTLRVRELP